MEKVYNLAQLEELAGGSSDFVNSMVETYLEHTPQQLNEMESALHSGDLITVGNVAHKIKPNIDLFGVTEIKDDIRVVEQKGKNGINDDELKEGFRQVKKYLELSFEQLRQR